jgi:multiple sugar transport system permease protein
MTSAAVSRPAESQPAKRPLSTRPVPLGGRIRRLRRQVIPYVFLSPFLLTFLAFVVYPLLYAANLSTTRTKIIGGTSFVGIDNYIRALSDEYFWTGVRNVASFGLIQVPIMLGLALLAALLLDSGIIKRPTLFRLGFFLPFAVPSVVAALIWGYLYGQAFGPVAQIATFFNIDPPEFLSPGSIIPALANISTWQYAGYNMVIMYAALKAIPVELYEAARVDGAGGIQIAWKIKIPLIAPAIMLTLIFSVIGTLQLFNEPNVMRQVAPAAIGPNFTPNLYVYNLAFQNQQFDYSAAIAFTLATVTVVLVSFVLIINGWRTRRSA